ncbi:MAG: carbonic anhydrase family protein [Reichenbachiella sp.]|uniref:carbonic anhydrase n=1 Tax=Reichenbachiella sp. TaxID=2184521 RepID=UPI003264BB95
MNFKTIRIASIVLFAFAFQTCNDEQNVELNNSEVSDQEQLQISDRWGYEDENGYETRNARLASPPVHWSYDGATGPDFWSTLSPDFVLCSEGNRQSPIDLSTNSEDEDDGDQIEYHYSVGPLLIENNGHTIVFSSTPHQNYITLGGTRYDLAQFHGHASSEHTVDGTSFPLELHFVHANPLDNSDLLVIGLLVEQGSTATSFTGFWNNFPAHEGDEVEVSDVNIFSLLPTDKSVYNYSGSLTTPPCSEGVNWNVLTSTIEMSASQISSFSVIYDHNFRPIQDLNNRPVVILEGDDDDNS